MHDVLIALIGEQHNIPQRTTTIEEQRMKPTLGLPKVSIGLKSMVYVNLKGNHKEVSLMLPMGWTNKPMYHLVYLARTFGLQSRWLLVTFDWYTKGNKRYRMYGPNWRIQWQRKQFGTKYSVMIAE